MSKVLIHYGKFSEEPVDSCGTTPGMDAIRSGHVAIARQLADAKIFNFESRDGIGWASIHLAAQVHKRFVMFPGWVMFKFGQFVGWLQGINGFST